MEAYWRKYFIRTALFLPASLSLGYLNFSTLSTAVFFLGVIWALNPLDQRRKKNNDWKPVAIGSTVYLIIAIIIIGISWYLTGVIETIL